MANTVVYPEGYSYKLRYGLFSDKWVIFHSELASIMGEYLLYIMCLSMGYAISNKGGVSLYLPLHYRVSQGIYHLIYTLSGS